MRITPLFFALFALVCTGVAMPAVSMAAEKRVIIGFRQAPGALEDSAVVARKGKIKRKFKHLRVLAASLPEEEISNLKNNPLVAYVQEDVRVQMIRPLAASIEYQNAWGVERIGSRAVHQQGNTGTSATGNRVKIAVIDSGIDSSHPELTGVFAGGTDIVFGDATPDDENGHGTHVAGVIAAALNDTGVVGVAPSAEIYAVRVMDGSGLGLVSWILEGIDWAITNQMDIINLSLETPDDLAVKQACDQAWEAGILVVGAAGNAGVGSVAFPAAYDSVIAVGGTMIDDQIAAFSNTGPEIELAAPGMDITSTYLNGEYRGLSGTSEAAPHVSGVAALVMANGIEDLNGNGRINDEVRFRLQQTATDFGVVGRDNLYGFGLVNAANAVNFQEIPGTDPGPFTPLTLDLTRSDVPRENDALQVILPGGTYLVTIKHSTLKRLFVEVYENGQRVPGLSRVVHFRGKKTKNHRLLLNAPNGPYDVWLTPDGRVGSGAQVGIDSYQPPVLPAVASQNANPGLVSLRRAFKAFR